MNSDIAYATRHVFPMPVDARFRLPLLALGVRAGAAYVAVEGEKIDFRFGYWRASTQRSNIAGVEVSGPYRWYRVIGARLSLADRGATFGTNADRGICLLFHEPIAALVPGGWLRHPGLTVTVADPEGLRATLSTAARSGH